MGGFDDRLVTRDQMDFAMRVLTSGRRVTFCREAIVTYMALEKLSAVDLGYFLFRWADAHVMDSLDAFEQTWGIRLNQQGTRHAWTAKHRARAAAMVYPWRRRLLGRRLFQLLVVRPMETALLAEQARLRPAKQPSVPHAPVKARVDAVIRELSGAQVVAA
jgi:hypothetical protein